MTFNRFAAVVTFVGLTFSAAGVARAAEDETRLANVNGIIVPMAPMTGYQPSVKRPRFSRRSMPRSV